ncbi:hypothetical protein ASG35_11740 [Burkholderia sp. Leaf177]|uniref:hypothetical protein n=1 Tax=Burkholderia sp. Leaf177 TaxID=1736287 RepID=UPI0006F72D0B|nr:hypothetical protein [Burkholderia sp. Leaf177]KQR76950.1 hypothetical protein ASG35_11740 [Burkholderia sp. Leaf177]
MSVTPCDQNKALTAKIEAFAEVLKTEAHKLGKHGLDEKDFYNSGLFRGAVERVRGQFSATMRSKREFVQHVLNHMEDGKFIAGWEKTEDANRNDYLVNLASGKIAIIDLKGCLDGNNTNIFERPAIADEFVIWSICTNPGADPRRNAWSGIHTRLSAEILSRNQRVDGLVVWDMMCGTIGRPCPKVVNEGPSSSRMTEVGPFRTPPPCIYLFPASIPTQDAPSARAQALSSVELLGAFSSCFFGRAEELSYVDFDLSSRGSGVVRKTTVRRAGVIQRESKMVAIRRV